MTSAGVRRDAEQRFEVLGAPRPLRRRRAPPGKTADERSPARHRDEPRAGGSRHLDAQAVGPAEGHERARAAAQLRAAQGDPRRAL